MIFHYGMLVCARHGVPEMLFTTSGGVCKDKLLTCAIYCFSRRLYYCPRFLMKLFSDRCRNSRQIFPFIWGLNRPCISTFSPFLHFFSSPLSCSTSRQSSGPIKKVKFSQQKVLWRILVVGGEERYSVVVSYFHKENGSFLSNCRLRKCFYASCNIIDTSIMRQITITLFALFQHRLGETSDNFNRLLWVSNFNNFFFHLLPVYFLFNFPPVFPVHLKIFNEIVVDKIFKRNHDMLCKPGGNGYSR